MKIVNLSFEFLQDDEITPREALFVQEWLVDFNGKRAARAAGFSESTSTHHAGAVLARKRVKRYMAEEVKKRMDKLEISQENVLRELARIAFSDPRAVMSWTDGNLKMKSSNELSDDEAASISEVVLTETKVSSKTGIKLYDKLSALDKLARYLALYKDVGTPENPQTIITENKFKDLSDAQLAVLDEIARKIEPAS